MSPESIAIEDYLQRRSLELLLDGARWSVATFGHFFVIWLLVWTQSPAVGPTAPNIWAAALSLVLVFQALYASFWRPGRLRHLNAGGVTRSLRAFTISAWLVGACWATAGIVLFPPEHQELQLFLVFVMGGMSLAAVGTQHVYLPACYGSMGFAVPVLAARYGWEGSWIEPVLLVLYTLVILRLARMLSRFSMRTIRLQHERDQLLAELTHRARDLEKARKEAEEANLAKSRFLAQASHDLRQPLHAIGLFVESLTSKQITPQVAHVVNRVRDSLGMLSNLFDSLLDVTVLDAGSTKVNRVNFRLEELFAQLEQDFAPIAEEASVKIRFARTSATLHTDPVLFRRLLQNLVSNAIRYAPGGRVLIGARRRDGRVTVAVADNGPGIAQADQERIFQEFVKLEKSGTAKTTGLGLGLAIVRRLARLLDLKIDMTSAVGRGTCFTIAQIPSALGTPVPLMDRKTPEDTDLLIDTRVLIVDDDPEILDATRTLLERWGCEVLCFQQFPAILPDVDIVLSDYELANADGLDALKRLDGTLVHRVLISGNSSEALRSAAAAASIPLLHKPVRPVKLRSLLLHLLVQEDA